MNGASKHVEREAAEPLIAEEGEEEKQSEFQHVSDHEGVDKQRVDKQRVDIVRALFGEFLGSCFVTFIALGALLPPSPHACWLRSWRLVLLLYALCFMLYALLTYLLAVFVFLL